MYTIIRKSRYLIRVSWLCGREGNRVSPFYEILALLLLLLLLLTVHVLYIYIEQQEAADIS